MVIKVKTGAKIRISVEKSGKKNEFSL